MTTKTIPVDVVGDHPHTGRRGTIKTSSGMVKTTRVLGGPPMVEVTFGEHDACFAEARHLRWVKP